jgi:hypothetical protein
MIEKYITGKGQSVFNSSHEALIAIPKLASNELIKIKYSVEYDGWVCKWYISWTYKNPQFKETESFCIEI